MEDIESLDNLTNKLNEISLNRSIEGPSVFQCQIKIFQKWYSNWDASTKLEFSNKLKTNFPDFTTSFEKQSNGTFD